MSLRPLVIAWKELLQLRRDRLTLAMMAVMPVALLLLFGYAINTDVRHIPTLVDDQDATRGLARPGAGAWRQRVSMTSSATYGATTRSSARSVG